ncbi:protein STICHEL-like 3 [Nicotiana sylvestris]|uniref:Protein STICHEL-like 3 n=2 Tax=Nicotiana TaxID=4085 RepID=A0A1S4BFB8_TOBAC|nr:PREDICTED: protein STICHEL-like 3 [Nicotiana sylvestris]XP_016487571.1 PREDICTED: protein STICHEL-like 3 [Nicotiana tabacum]XP_016487572.1 PREDICTED: protein STICHEL-like 3 [Nicotiana tabacum]
MTRAVRDRILKDANGNISDHLRNHIHLTNCIHLKNHMHKQSPILGDRSLMRELVVLQRSRSLRDPSASPPSWHSPSVVDALLKTSERRDAVVSSGRRSLGVDRPMNARGLSGSSPPLAGRSTSRVASAEINTERVAGAPSDRSSKSGIRERRRVRREESSGRNLGTDFKDERPDDLVHNTVSENSELRDRISNEIERQRCDDRIRTLSEQLNNVPMDSDEVASSHGRQTRNEKFAVQAEATTRGYGSSRVKQRKFRRARRARASVPSRDALAHNEMSVASNSLGQASAHQKYHAEECYEEYANQNVARAPRNGCGIPWNWSRIHHRGKSFLDMAGKSLSCGLSDPRSKRSGIGHRGRDSADMPIMSEYSSSSSQSEAEALPLLLDASNSQGSTDNPAWVHNYSGELGIYADNLLKQELDSDLASEARSGQKHKFRRRGNSRHQSLTQKYMPRTFRDLVGQNLVAQALSNAAVKRKVGLLYVFYGPHGTGKTSCARIFARSLNCQSIEHPKPCGFCDSCVAHDMGRSRNIREIGPVSNFDFENMMDLLDNMIVSKLPSQYRVFIFDDCDTLSPDCWSAILKVVDRAPRRVIFMLVSSSLDVLPHIIISRCQKFFFPKLKDADIIYTLQWIATKEDLEIDKDALKLIASRSDGSLRDAEMTLEQLSLLGQRISVPLVQELVGLISDEKLVDLLDLALSADTVNTVKHLREIMESGVEPLALMSQLATVITDILAGSYDFTKERPRRKFFRRQALSKQDMEKLRQALKTLSEAEKQLRMSNDRLTWLTAALLQLAPDQQYMLPNSSADTSFIQSPLGLNNAGGTERPRKSNVEHADLPHKDTKGRVENFQAGSSGDIYSDSRMKGVCIGGKGHNGAGVFAQKAYSVSSDKNRMSSGQLPDKLHHDIEEIWLEVLQNIEINGLKEFMYREGKLTSLSFGAAPTVQLLFSSHLTKSKVEKFRGHILQAFESVLGSPVTIEIRCESGKDVRAGPMVLSASHIGASPSIYGNGMRMAGPDENTRTQVNVREGLAFAKLDSRGIGDSEIIEEEASPRELKHHGQIDNNTRSDLPGGTMSIAKNSSTSIPERRKSGDRSQSLSLVKSKVSLAHVIQQAEGYTQPSSWSKRKAVSIAEKLEQENLRLEPRSRSLLCWKAKRITRRKLSRLKTRSRRPKSLLKLVSCGKCLSGRSPR